MLTTTKPNPSSSRTAADTRNARRQFLGHLSGAAATLSLVATNRVAAQSNEGAVPEAAARNTTHRRAQAALQIRLEAARNQHRQPVPVQRNNADESEYSQKIGCFTKTLPHNGVGEVQMYAWDLLKNALRSGQANEFEAIPLGGTVKLANPQAAYTFDLEGADSHALRIEPAPKFSSSETASEMVELYWQALTRDVPFTEYDSNPLIHQAAADLSRFVAFKGPRANGIVTPDTLFRSTLPGDVSGPYISQFLWQDVPSGAAIIKQQYRVPVAGNDFMTDYGEWLHIQNGGAPTRAITYDTATRYLRNGRDLGEYVHRDFTYQAFLNAALVLLSYGRPALPAQNPYVTSRTQSSFATFGGPHVLDVVARVANAALRAAWYQKWLVHMRVRPEAYAGAVHNHTTGAASYSFHRRLLNSPVLEQVARTFGSYLLPQAYAEGCPTHPAYPSGHATIAGACVTVLKTFFNVDFVLPRPVVASADGLSLLPYQSTSLTVGGELHKLAANVGIGRNTAGVHWRSDAAAGFQLGEAVALSCLQDFRRTFSEDFGGFKLTTFAGDVLTL
ncbi:MAG TPA: phosphatase PAP2 family protein [Blastocatellia bacterium]|nr:phosphatase PAP2 family protein [Blastocatellia bacterium]